MLKFESNPVFGHTVFLYLATFQIMSSFCLATFQMIWLCRLSLSGDIYIILVLSSFYVWRYSSLLIVSYVYVCHHSSSIGPVLRLHLICFMLPSGYLANILVVL